MNPPDGSRWLSFSTFCLSILLQSLSVDAVKVIQNGLAAPEVVHSPVSLKPRCIVHADPLDLIFVLDSSGSLRNKFQDEIDVIRRIVKHVTIGPEATRVMLVQFSGIQHLEFDFHKFVNRIDLLNALDMLRHVSGITRIGGALEFTMSKMTADLGMRDSSIPKIVYILSDGRTHDYPKDYQEADRLRRQFTNVDIWAYGTGEYVATPALLNYTKSEDKIITNKNLEKLESLFDKWKGSEICEKVPVCVKGSDKPVDMVLLIDASESVDKLFDQQIEFAIERVIQNVNIHPEATRLSLISFSGKVFTHFTFNSYHVANNSAVIRHLNTLRSIKGTTATNYALQEAHDLYTTHAKESGVRPNATKLVIILTDGHSHRPPGPMAEELRKENVTILAVSVAPRPFVDERELLSIAGDESKVFTPVNLQDFEAELFKYVGYGCPGMDIGKNATPEIRGATDVTCDANSLTFTVRTQKPMQGSIYALHYGDKEDCMTISDGSSRQVSIRLRAGSCGVEKNPSLRGDGYAYNVSMVLQFHPLVMTRADQVLEVSCFHSEAIPPQEIARSTIRSISDASCSYRLHRYAPNQCIALDAKVGESIYHKWDCDAAPNYQYLVHDCYARSERKNVKFIDSDGCELDENILETPNYNKILKRRLNELYVHQEMSVFKFPGDNSLLFECQLSLCDMESEEPCTSMIPPRCSNKEKKNEQKNVFSELRRRAKRAAPSTKNGFLRTLAVETRTLNVVESETMRQGSTVRYCPH